MTELRTRNFLQPHEGTSQGLNDDGLQIKRNNLWINGKNVLKMKIV